MAPDLKSRLETNNLQQDVLTFSIPLRYAGDKLPEPGNLLLIEGPVRKAVALIVGDISSRNVIVALRQDGGGEPANGSTRRDQSEALPASPDRKSLNFTVEGVVTPPADKDASFLRDHWQSGMDKEEDRNIMQTVLVSELKKDPSSRVMFPDGLEVTGKVDLEVALAVYPDFKLGTKHNVAKNTFKLLEETQALAGARVIRCRGGPHVTGSAEGSPVDTESLKWAMQKLEEQFKDKAFEKLFTVVVASLQQASSSSCRDWVATIPPAQLRNLLHDNPVKQQICNSSAGAHQQQQKLQAYLSRCPTYVALAAAAVDAARLWVDELAPEDKSFLKDAAGHLTGWPHLTVTMARSLFDAAACRFLVIDGLIRGGMFDDSLRYLRQCPKDLVRQRIKTPWRQHKQATFLHLYETAAESQDREFMRQTVKALVDVFSPAESDLLANFQSFIEDWTVPGKFKQDFCAELVAECRPQPAEVVGVSGKKWWFWGSSSPKGAPKTRATRATRLDVPNIVGIDVIIMKAVLAQFMTKTEKASTGGGLRSNDEDLADMFEMSLLVATGTKLADHVKNLANEDSRLAEGFVKFLRTIGVRRVHNMFQGAIETLTAADYDDELAEDLGDGIIAWSYNAGDDGELFSQKAAAKRNSFYFTQLLLSFSQVDMAVSAAAMWTLTAALKDDGNAGSRLFSVFAPPDSHLRKILATHIVKYLPEQCVSVETTTKLCGSFAFSSEAFRNIFAVEDMVSWAKKIMNEENAPPGGVVDNMLGAIVRVCSFSGGFPDTDAPNAFMYLAEHLQTPAAALLMDVVFSHVIVRPLADGADAVTLMILCDCAREVLKAGQVLEHKLRKGDERANSLQSGTVKALDSILCKGSPESWPGSLRSLDTIIFTLEYMAKEDFVLAKERFKFEVRKTSHRKKMLWELLACVNTIYKDPIAGSDASGISTDMDMRTLFQKNAAILERPSHWRGVEFTADDWQLVIEIAAAAAECMKEKYNVVMIPHHTQMLALLMFAVRACGIGKVTSGLPQTMLARVGTGEGKSLIIGMLAAFVAKKGFRAHVINDQRVLTRRDFQTNQSMFHALGLTATCESKYLRNSEYQIVYCTGDDVEKASVQSLVDGKSREHEKELSSAVLIVDEVDGMIFDKGPASTKEFNDPEFSDWVNTWLSQLETTGHIEKDWDDFRAAAEMTAQIQREVEQAHTDAYEKREGRDYAERGGVYYMLDPKTRAVQENGWSLWLDVIRRQKKGWNAQYRYVKAVLCRLQCFRTYSCIFGLTGSLGQDAEKKYLLEYYDAMTFNVPYFLDTCRPDDPPDRAQLNDEVVILGEDGDKNTKTQRRGTTNSVGILKQIKSDLCHVDFGGGLTGWYKSACISKCPTSKRGVMDIGSGEVYDGTEQQESIIVELASSKCLEVPVLILAKTPEHVHRIANLTRQRLGGVYAEGAGGVVELLQNPRNPEEFVDTVNSSTEPLDAVDENGLASHSWKITITTAEGGRGHDYRVTDPAIDDKGGLLLILSWVPWSEREWIQFLGRTSRQDHAGQFAAILDGQDPEVKTAQAVRQASEKLPITILNQGNLKTSATLASMGGEIKKARLMHQLTSHYWAAHVAEETDKNQDWDWKRLCADFAKLGMPETKDRFSIIVPGVHIEDITDEPIQEEEEEVLYEILDEPSTPRKAAEFSSQSTGSPHSSPGASPRPPTEAPMPAYIFGVSTEDDNRPSPDYGRDEECNVIMRERPIKRFRLFPDKAEKEKQLEEAIAAGQIPTLKCMAELVCARCGQVSFADRNAQHKTPTDSCKKCDDKLLLSAYVSCL